MHSQGASICWPWLSEVTLKGLWIWHCEWSVYLGHRTSIKGSTVLLQKIALLPLGSWESKDISLNPGNCCTSYSLRGGHAWAIVLGPRVSLMDFNPFTAIILQKEGNILLIASSYNKTLCSTKQFLASFLAGKLPKSYTRSWANIRLFKRCKFMIRFWGKKSKTHLKLSMFGCLKSSGIKSYQEIRI